MSKEINFQNTAIGPIQVDRLKKDKIARFVCNAPFSIIFKSGPIGQYMDAKAQGAWKELANAELSEFASSESKEKGKYVVEIRFKDGIPDAGLDYTIRTKDGELDPRVVPPR